MELRHLRYFLAVADTAHFRRAAEALRVSQPTLSLQVQQLEGELGTLLFERVGRRVRLTQAGEVFRDHARRALRVLDEGQTALDELGGLLRGRLTVGAVQTAAAYLLPPVVARFSAAHPRVHLRVEELSAGEIEAGVSEGRLDLGVSFVPAGSEVETEGLFTEALVLVVPDGHRWVSRRKVRTAELEGEPLVLLPMTFCTRRLIDDGLRAAGVTPLVVAEMNTVGGIVATVRAGGPATILPALATAGGGVRVVGLESPSFGRQVGLLARRGAYPLRARASFAEAVRAAVREKNG